MAKGSIGAHHDDGIAGLQTERPTKMTTLSAPIDAAALARSREYCRDLTRRAARNFYYGLKLLPEPRRSAMFALYAYMRLVDDIADDHVGRSPTQRLEDLQNWHARTREILNGQMPADDHPVWPAFFDLVHRYGIPAKVFEAILAGQRQDLEPIQFETFDELEEYCYRVAGVVGLASIHVWGFEGGQATEALSLHRGTAFQLTNILRDLREDAARGRLYLPRPELAEYGITLDQLRAGEGGPRFESFMRFQIDRARSYYAKSTELETQVDRASRPTLIAMTQI